MKERHAEIGGHRMRWLENGDGDPVVFVHGIPTSAELWGDVLPLVGQARCLAWEMLGYGGSMRVPPETDIGVSAQAEYLRLWLHDLGIDRAVLVGHDLGGGVVQILAVRHPEMCAGLVLVNAIGYDSWPISSVRALQRGAALVERLPRLLFRAVFSSFVRRGHDGQARAREAVDRHWPWYAVDGGAAGFARQLRSLDTRDTLAVAADLPSLAVPARIVWGDADRFQKLRYGERFARDLRTTVLRVPGGKHFVPEDHPEAVARAVGELLGISVSTPAIEIGGHGARERVSSDLSRSTRPAKKRSG